MLGVERWMFDVGRLSFLNLHMAAANDKAQSLVLIALYLFYNGISHIRGSD